MNALTTFNFTPALALRAITRAGEPWFVAADVCKALDMDVTKGASRWTAGLDEDEKTTLRISGGRGAPAVVISESGLYTLILRSRKPEARAFKRWVTSEVLPTIRKTGMYVTAPVAKEVVEDPAAFMARALLVANDTLKRLTVQAKGMEPTTTAPITVREFRKELGLRLTASELGSLAFRASAMADTAGHERVYQPGHMQVFGVSVETRVRIYSRPTLERAAASLGFI